MRKFIVLLTGFLLLVMLGGIASARADSVTNDFFGSYIGGAGTYSSPAQYWIHADPTFTVVEVVTNSCDYHQTSLSGGNSATLKVCFRNRHTTDWAVGLGLVQTYDDEQMTWSYSDYGAPSTSLASLEIDWSAHDTDSYDSFTYLCGSGSCPSSYSSPWVNAGHAAEYDVVGQGKQCHWRAWGRYGAADWLVKDHGANVFAGNAAPFAGTVTSGCFGG